MKTKFLIHLEVSVLVLLAATAKFAKIQPRQTKEVKVYPIIILALANLPFETFPVLLSIESRINKNSKEFIGKTVNDGNNIKYGLISRIP